MVAVGTGPKILISRISRHSGDSMRAKTKHACRACQRRRIKCDGARPACRGCLVSGTECLYAERKRVRDMQELLSMKSTVDQYGNLLKDLLHEVPPDVAKRIKSTLTATKPYPSNGNASVSGSSSSSAGSAQGIDMISEDLNRNEESRGTGFMENNSVHAWLHNPEQDNRYRNWEAMGRTPLGQPISRQGLENNMTVSYFLDATELPAADTIGTYNLPPKDLADRILHSYFQFVHSVFPVVRSDLFLEQYKSLWDVNSRQLPSHKWLAVYNMILAIGCKRLQMVQESLPTGVSHEIFFSRARSLCLGENMIFEHADLQQVQVEALVTLYLLVSMQINRAWKVSSIAARSAMTLAINLRILSTDLQPGSKEARSRLWWSIYVLEIILATMTGRPTCIRSSSLSAEQPVPYSENMFDQPKAMDLLTNESVCKKLLRSSLDEQRNENDNCDRFQLQDVETNQDLLFYYLVDLMHIVHSAIGESFAFKVSHANGSHVKRRIHYFDNKLDSWLSRLPPELHFIDLNSNLDLRTAPRQKTVLALHYYDARITVHRPYSPFRRYDSPGEKKDMSINEGCLQAALNVIEIFPDVVDLDWVYKTSPWWCILHFLMQASTILLIFSRSSDNPDKDAERNFVGLGMGIQVQAGCQKAHMWLQGLSEVDESCRGALLRYDDLVRSLGVI